MKTSPYASALLIGLVGLLAPNAAWADSIEYTVNGTFGGGTTTLTGTLTIDSTTGQTISGTVTITGVVSAGPLSLRVSEQPTPGNWNDLFNNGVLPSVDFGYDWPPSALSSVPLISQTAVDICGVDVCGIFSANPTIGFDGGSLTQVPAPVPEPSSLLLLGTGLAGLLGAMRRKLGLALRA